VRRPTLLAIGATVALQLFFPTALATPATRSAAPHSALGGFVKDRALARVLGETLFRDTVDVMSDPTSQSAAAPALAGQDHSAVARVARTVLAQQKLDKYLWLIQQAFDDTLWKGGDRARIEQHFPLIWRTSIMLYEATLSASPHRVRVCSPAENGDGFDCRDEIVRARIVPIPAGALLIQAHQPTTG
jgi:hypothetical protein